MYHRTAVINLENKALVGELCRLGGEIGRFPAKKSKTRTNRAHATKDLVTCKLAQLTRMVVDSMLNINNTIGSCVDMVIRAAHYMSGFVRVLCTVNKWSLDN